MRPLTRSTIAAAATAAAPTKAPPKKNPQAMKKKTSKTKSKKATCAAADVPIGGEGGLDAEDQTTAETQKNTATTPMDSERVDDLAIDDAAKTQVRWWRRRSAMRSGCIWRWSLFAAPVKMRIIPGQMIPENGWVFYAMRLEKTTIVGKADRYTFIHDAEKKKWVRMPEGVRPVCVGEQLERYKRELETHFS
ncbi:hypothetical protein B0H14DRAFT_3508178 [Mycena olivaceomarginata]|nr:hypothetical protein B0H14DRAFT_3508178 [Mycena olivaceomarginata]